MFNEEIETIFTNFTVDDILIPVSYLRYKGNKTTYITYTPLSNGNSYSGDDNILGYVQYYDFDVYSKKNYYLVMEIMKQMLIDNGWTWQPSKDSSDLFEEDTGYFHKTLCFAKPIQRNTIIPR